MTSRLPDTAIATSGADGAATQPLPNSRKVYVTGSRPDIRVPMREISLADTRTDRGVEANPPVLVYDTSGPYTDPAARIDLRSGLADVQHLDRGAWRYRDTARAELAVRPRTAGRCLAGCHALCPCAHAAPGQGRPQRDPDALCAPRHHHAGDGVRRHSREHEAGRGPGSGAAAAPASGAQFRRCHRAGDHPRVRP